MDRATRAMLALVISMGALILIGTTVVIVTLVQRSLGGHHATSPRAAERTPVSTRDRPLEVPPGSRIISMTSCGGRLALLVTGGGADEVVLIDPSDGSKIAILRVAP